MRNLIPLLLIVLGHPDAASAADPVLPAPLLDLRAPGKPPLLSTWAFAEGKSRLDIESNEAREIIVRQFQVDGNSVIPLAGHPAPQPLKPGLNRLEIPMPAKSQRGTVLCKIGVVSESTPDGRLIANLLVNILPKDAWTSLSKQAGEDYVFIDTAFEQFKAWATERGISSPQILPATPILYRFGKPAKPSEPPASSRFIIFERDAPDAYPVIEVIDSPTQTKIILPPGFLESVPDSATAQALLLKHLNLLP